MAMDSTAGTDQDVGCWICLGDEGDLSTFCGCPGRLAHRQCLARWCLQQAGKTEESQCRFCGEALPDYRATLLAGPGYGSGGGAAIGEKPPGAFVSTDATATVPMPFMRVTYGNTVVVMQLAPGEEGRQRFDRDVKQILGLPADQKLNINFNLRTPGVHGSDQSDSVQLAGIHTYDAAYWCASVTAAQRQQAAGPSAAREAQAPTPEDIIPGAKVKDVKVIKGAQYPPQIKGAQYGPRWQCPPPGHVRARSAATVMPEEQASLLEQGSPRAESDGDQLPSPPKIRLTLMDRVALMFSANKY